MNQLSLFEKQTLPPHQPSSDTSILAAHEAKPKVSPQKQRILGTMLVDGGWTQDEIAYVLEMPRSTVCARMNEMEKDGLIRKNGETRNTRYGHPAAVYVVPA